MYSIQIDQAQILEISFVCILLRNGGTDFDLAWFDGSGKEFMAGSVTRQMQWSCLLRSKCSSVRAPVSASGELGENKWKTRSRGTPISCHTL